MGVRWYSGQTVSMGSSDYFASERKPYRFELAPGCNLSQVLSISSSNKVHFAWFYDGTVSEGTIDNFDIGGAPKKFKVDSA